MGIVTRITGKREYFPGRGEVFREWLSLFPLYPL